MSERLTAEREAEIRARVNAHWHGASGECTICTVADPLLAELDARTAERDDLSGGVEEIKKIVETLVGDCSCPACSRLRGLFALLAAQP